MSDTSEAPRRALNCFVLHMLGHDAGGLGLLLVLGSDCYANRSRRRACMTCFMIAHESREFMLAATAHLQVAPMLLPQNLESRVV